MSIRRIGFLGLMLASVALLAVGGTTPAVDLRLLVPLYIHPSWWDEETYVWDDVAAANSLVPVTAIINPNNGPDGGPPDEDYTVGLADLRDAGVSMVGYVYTSYGARDIAEVEADIDLYSQHYDIDGIFLDEVSTSTTNLPYYADLYTYIHGKTNLPLVITNPGTKVPEAYLSTPATDTAVIFENGSGWRTYVPDAYVSQYPGSRFASLMYNVGSAETMRTNIDLAVRRNMHYVYATDDSGGNPWDTLPTYWTQLVDYVAAYRNLRAISTGRDGSDTLLRFSSLSNRPYRIEWSGDLGSGAWSNLTATATSTGAVVEARDTNAAPAARMYRLKHFP